MTTYFDISTAARWSGHAVGIIRVERELARRAAALDGMAYCVYDRGRNAFLELKPAVAAAILDGELLIEFNPQPTAPIVSDTFRFRARQWFLAKPKLYQAFQRLRGREFTLAQIEEVKSQEAVARAATSKPLDSMSLAEAAFGTIALGPDVRILSGGLDWEYKDLRAIYDLKKDAGFSYFAIIYDLIPQTMPHFVVPAYVNLLKDYFGELFWVADGCMCISEATQRDMLAFCASGGAPTPKSATFPLGCDVPVRAGDAEVGEVMPLELEGKRYAIFVSTIEPRKNHRTLYQAWARCIADGRLDPTKVALVFVGRCGWAVENLLQEIDANEALEGSIVRLSNVSDAQLDLLYRNAEFGLFPSFYEGYGLPLVEMLNYGKACISSPAGSLPEVGGDLVDYVDPLDALGWADAIARLFNDTEARRALESRVASDYRPVTWDAASEIFFERLGSL